MLKGDGTKMVGEGDRNIAKVERGRGEEGLAAWSDAFHAQVLVVRELDRRLKENETSRTRWPREMFLYL